MSWRQASTKQPNLKLKTMPNILFGHLLMAFALSHLIRINLTSKLSVSALLVDKQTYYFPTGSIKRLGNRNKILFHLFLEQL
jgi:hypothetical protein